MTSAKKDAVEAFKTITDHFAKIKIAYDEGANPMSALYEMGVAAAWALAEHASVRAQGELDGLTKGSTKVYDVFLTKDGKRVSRPVRQDLYLKNPNVFKRAWSDFVEGIDKKKQVATSESTNAAIYTCLCAVACAYDLFKPGSRKTPGTFFEVLAGSIIGEVANLPRGKQVTLPDSKYKVPTDIVLINNKGPQLVIPTKITTRERIVQVWAQQRILQDVFGKEKYLSILVSMSELQRDEDDGVNEICVPGQVGLFQKYLATVSGMYYLDVPKSYGTGEISKLVTVGDFGQLLGGDLRKLLS